MVELADTTDLKSVEIVSHEGSSPSGPTGTVTELSIHSWLLVESRLF